MNKFKHLGEIQFHSEQSLKEVLDVFLTSYIQHYGFGVIVDDQRKCIGVVTDGDIRRAIVSGNSADTHISEIMHRNFVSATVDTSPHQLLRLFDLDHEITHLPVLDKKGRLINVLLSSDFNANTRIEKKVIRSRSPVRISFGGGGTDMSYYFRKDTGYVLSSTINKYCYATVSLRSDNRINLISKDFNMEIEADNIKQLKYDGSMDLIKACVKLMHPPFGFDLETFSDIEPGTGLGGSAALASAIIGAFNRFRNESQLDKYAMADLAYQAERMELRIKGGWQDQYAVVFGGVNFMEFREDETVVIPLRIQDDILLELHFNLLLFRVGETRESGVIISDQHKNYLSKTKVLHNKYNQLSQVTLEMKDKLLKGALRKFGELLDEAWEIKKTFSDKITTNQIEKLYKAAKKNGAIGGKLLGAGYGGYLLLYCDPKYQPYVIESLQASGAVNVTFDFVEKGIQTWTAKDYYEGNSSIQ
jgi:D-glycero-alpha-D-manno-heptose-7-phosphate kinase